MRTKILAALFAGGLLVGAGFVAAMTYAPGTAQAREETGEDDEGPALIRPSGILGEVLEELVGDGTITRDQADAIAGAVRERAGDLKEQRGQWLEDGRRHLRHHLRSGFRFGALLDGGGIDEDEYASLGDDHPLKRLDVGGHLDDGLITPEELREIFHELRHSRFGADS